MGSISIWQLLVIAGVVVLLFGTNKLRNLGSDLGFSIRAFKKAMSDEDDKKDQHKEQDADFNTKTVADKQQTLARKDDARDK